VYRIRGGGGGRERWGEREREREEVYRMGSGGRERRGERMEGKKEKEGRTLRAYFIHPPLPGNLVSKELQLFKKDGQRPGNTAGSFSPLISSFDSFHRFCS
jgi:hypothetical protein